MNNLFTQNLTKSNDSIKKTRAERIGKAAERSQRALVDSLEKQVDDLENQLEDLEDLSPDSELSLQPVKDGEFDADAWVNNIQETKVSLANLKLELEVAQKTYAKYFTEVGTTNAAE